jgi:signal transduction histidine kinase
MTTRAQQLVAALTRKPDIEHIEVGRMVMWAGLLTSALPCGLLLAIGLLGGLALGAPLVYAGAVLLYMGMLLLIDIPSRVSRWLWRRLWLFLLALGLVGLVIQSMINESFLQPIIFLVPMIYAALAYNAARVAVVAVCYLGLMNLGIWLSGVREPVAFLFPTFGYGTFMVFSFAFTRLSVEQAIARREADRLAADLARERDYMARLVEMTATLTRDLDLATVLAQVAAAGRTLARAEQARVWLRDSGEPGAVRLAAAVPPQPLDVVSTPGERWGVATIEGLANQASGMGLLLPLVSKGATIGALELQGAPARPSAADDARLLQPFADVAAVAIENARLFEQAGLSATLSERNRLARELHDTIAQGLTAVTMQLEAAQRGFERDPARARARVARAHELARDTLQDVRRSVWTLAAPLVDGHALGVALDDLTQRFAARTGIAASYRHDGPPPQIGHAAATQVLRIVQEALANVEKHARAAAVVVGSASADGELRVWVRDDGVGFAPDALASAGHDNGAASGGFGLISLRERARLAGGAIHIESAPGEGTRIMIVIPN